ncbi:TPA: ArsR/SmtB family transcription factor [Pseudomonas aeruginosa]|uniref:ArsR/SmtB family transcription factor n=1 Tax=Stutzerimonas kunmingensis TaxID=1211807 RepID=UPI0005B4A63E|nr:MULTISPECIES: metalloregulator ArsR/SmtB family transcription factor [Stutzerimonas stutzeri group]KJS23375.1 MAG: ArsR family transcriptional regulator [Pseudomonas sp. BRH_c35]KJS78843.1 MAG: ArsR family transcriptional regulator [[Pseudomonas] sp. BICA1-14]
MADLDIETLRRSATDACGLLKALGNPDRLLLLCQLTQGEYCVGDLASATGVEQPTLSQQLTVLRHNGLVSTRRVGKQVHYSIASQQAMEVMQVLYRLYCQHPEIEDPSK